MARSGRSTGDAWHAVERRPTKPDPGASRHLSPAPQLRRRSGLDQHDDRAAHEDRDDDRHAGEQAVHARYERAGTFRTRMTVTTSARSSMTRRSRRSPSPVIRGRPRPGCRWARRAPVPTRVRARGTRRPALGAMEGDRDVGPHDRGRGLAAELRSSAVGVSTASTGTPESAARTATSTPPRMGSRSGPRTPVPSRASIDEPGSLDAVEEESDVVGAWCQETRETPSTPSSRCQFVPASGVAGSPVATRAGRPRMRDAGRREVPRRDEAIAAVVARPAQDEDPRFAPAARARELSQGGRCDRGPGLLHQPLAGDPESLRPGVRAAHLLGADRPLSGLWRPAEHQVFEVEAGTEDVVVREWQPHAGERVRGRERLGCHLPVCAVMTSRRANAWRHRSAVRPARRARARRPRRRWLAASWLPSASGIGVQAPSV